MKGGVTGRPARITVNSFELSNWKCGLNQKSDFLTISRILKIASLAYVNETAQVVLKGVTIRQLKKLVAWAEKREKKFKDKPYGFFVHLSPDVSFLFAKKPIRKVRELKKSKRA